MLLPWRTWCGLCGDIPEDSYPDLRNDAGLLDMAVRCFSLTFERTFPLPVCPKCLLFLKSISEFSASCSRVRDMLSSLKKSPNVDPNEFRRTFLEISSTDIPTSVDEEPLLQKITGDVEDDQQDWQLFEVTEEQEANEAVPQKDDEEPEKFNEVELEEEPPEDDPEEYEEDDEEDESELLEFCSPGGQSKGTGGTSAQKKHCPQCNASFRFKYQLKDHLEERHPGKNFECSICGKRFKQFKALEKHLLIHESAEESVRFACEKCPRTFKTQRKLELHFTCRHSKEKWVCPQCGVVLSSRSTFNRHMICHSNSQVHKCPVCEKQFKRHKTLKDHLIIHTGLRPWSCPFCDKTFPNGSNCRSHKLKNHPAEMSALENSEAVMADCKNIPSMDELIAIALKKCGKSGNVEVTKIPPGRPPGQTLEWKGFTSKWSQSVQRYVAECNRCHSVEERPTKENMMNHRCSTEIEGTGHGNFMVESSNVT